MTTIRRLLLILALAAAALAAPTARTDEERMNWSSIHSSLAGYTRHHIEVMKRWDPHSERSQYDVEELRREIADISKRAGDLGDEYGTPDWSLLQLGVVHELLQVGELAVALPLARDGYANDFSERLVTIQTGQIKQIQALSVLAGDIAKSRDR